MDIEKYIEGLSKGAKTSSIKLRSLKADIKNSALNNIAVRLDKRREEIKRTNGIDYENGKRSGLPESLLDRLLLTDKRIDGMIESVKVIMTLEDPVGEIIGLRRPQGFVLEKVRIPIGVIAMIYESRPNVTVDAASLCLKSGNACILRGGSEAIESNKILIDIIKEAVEAAGIDGDIVQFVARKEHEGVSILVKQSGLVDLVIPRGGESLIKRVVKEATVPVIKHYKGVCHLYIDDDVDLDTALKVVYNAKVQRPGTCNALETLLVNRKIAKAFLPDVSKKLKEVELRGCKKAMVILPDIKEATEEDFYTEYLDMVLSIKIVEDIEEAIKHIEKYGSSHTDGIISKNTNHIEKFVEEVDSAVVTVNASTRLSDGGVFGLGAEIGISTDKLHSRGPMGVKELTTYKWVLRGNGDIRV